MMIDEPWVFSRYESAAQCRYMERYFHSDLNLGALQGFILIPDGPFLRKYLTLFEELFESNQISNIYGYMNLLLLESVAEFMDYRNTSPSILISSNEYKTESTVGNERRRIFTLHQKYKYTSKDNAVNVVALSDLSYKEKGVDDEFDMFSFQDLSVKDRARCALPRAANILLNGRTICDNTNIIILTEDELLLNSKSELSDSLEYMTCSEFISYLSRKATKEQSIGDDLIENHWKSVYERCNQEYRHKNRPRILSELNQTINDGYFEYYSQEALNEGLLNKKLFRGVIKVTDENPKEAYCTVHDGDEKIKYYLNEAHFHFNRSIDEDAVIIEPLPPHQWEEPLGRRRLVDISLDDDNSDERTTDNSIPSVNLKALPTARVVGLSSNNVPRRKYVSTMMQLSGNIAREESNILVIPMNVKIPKIRIKTRIQHEKILNKRLLVEIDDWQVESNLPLGHIVEILGDVGDLETEIKCLLLEHRIDLTPFSASAMASLPLSPPEGQKVIDEEAYASQRKDFRNTRRIFSVDPQGCQDIDDAMHAEVLSNGNIEIGVHIADVTHFLHQGSPLDTEAANRATTFYLVDRRFDMLPAILSSNLCSLHGKVDRLAISVIWTFSPDLEQVKSTWYGRSVIHNVAAMTYEQAHNILHDVPPEAENETSCAPLTAGAPVDKNLITELKNDLSILTKLSRKLKLRREIEGGAVDLSSGDRGSELKFILDKNGRPLKVSSKKEKEIHHTIAELMIMANSFVAETIFSHFPDNSLLRIHGEAKEDNFEDLERLLKMSGQSFDGSTNKSLAKSLSIAKSEQNKLNDALFQSLATRAMMEAQYICSGAFSGSTFSHYGLGISHYTHFTSPIRRYADIVVHRLLLSSVSPGGKAAPLKTTELAKLCDRLNSQNRVAKQSSMNCQRLFLSLYLSKTTEITQAVVIDLKQNGLIVYVPKFDFKGPVFLTDSRGNVQMDPKLFGLPSSSGMDPTLGFVALDGCRMLPGGKCTLHDGDENKKARLDVQIPEGNKIISFSTLDIITVQLSCDLSAIVSRIPPPRLHLVSVDAHNSKIPQIQSKSSNQSPSDEGKPIGHEAKSNLPPRKSIYSILSSIPIHPNVPDRPSGVSLTKTKGRIQSVKGRLFFNGYKQEYFCTSEEDESLSQQFKVFSVEEKAKQGDYDATRQIEREATARMQRLAAENRNTKRSKAMKKR